MNQRGFIRDRKIDDFMATYFIKLENTNQLRILNITLQMKGKQNQNFLTQRSGSKALETRAVKSEVC